MKEWKHFQEEAAKRDHRKIGRVRIVYVGFQRTIYHYLFKSHVLYQLSSVKLRPAYSNYIMINRNNL